MSNLHLNYKKIFKYQGAFSLIEIMVVLTILVILAAMAIPAYTRYVVETKFAEIFTVVAKYQKETELAFLETGTTPTNRTDTINSTSIRNIRLLSQNGIEYIHVYPQNFYTGWDATDALVFRGQYDVTARLIRWSCCQQNTGGALPTDVIPEKCSANCDMT